MLLCYLRYRIKLNPLREKQGSSKIFQWLTEQKAINLKKDSAIKEKVSHELANITLYIIRMADQLDVNFNEAVLQKITINNNKYPVNKMKGSAKKYSYRKAIEASNASTGIKIAVFSSAMNLFGFFGSLLANTIQLSN